MSLVSTARDHDLAALRKTEAAIAAREEADREEAQRRLTAFALRVETHRRAARELLTSTFGAEADTLTIGDPVLYVREYHEETRIELTEGNSTLASTVRVFEFPVTRTGSPEPARAFVRSSSPNLDYSYFPRDDDDTPQGEQVESTCFRGDTAAGRAEHQQRVEDSRHGWSHSYRNPAQRSPLAYLSATDFAVLLEPESDPTRYAELTRAPSPEPEPTAAPTGLARLFFWRR